MNIAEYAARAASLLQLVELFPGTNRAFRTGWPSKVITPELAREIWSDPLQPNIGVKPWPHWWVLDLDGPDTVCWWMGLCAEHPFVRTLTVHTPGREGGQHLWWQMPPVPEGKRLRRWLPGMRTAEVKHGPGIEVALPPSRRPEGRYEFDVTGPTSPQPTPDWLAALILRDDTGSDREANFDLGTLAREDTVWGGLASYTLDGVTDQTVADFPHREGERNDYLYWAACRFREMGADESSFKLLHEAALAAGLGETEIERTIGSAR